MGKVMYVYSIYGCYEAWQSLTLLLLYYYHHCYYYITITTATAATSVQVDGRTMPALLAAAYKGHLEIVQMLLESGKVNVDQQGSVVSILLYHLYIYIYI